MKSDTAAIGDIKEVDDLRAIVASLQQENTALKAELENAKKLVREDTARISERTGLLNEYQDRLAMLEAEFLALKSAQGTDQSNTISVQEAWKAAGGIPSHQATRAELLYNLMLLNDVCEDLDEPDDSESGNGAILPFSLRAVPQSAVMKAFDTVLRDISSGFIDILRAEPSLSLPGERRLALYADRVRAMQVGSYVNTAIEDMIAQIEKEAAPK